MIIANKDGWLVAAELITETTTEWILKPFDDGLTVKVKKSETERKVFDNVKDAITWICEL